MYELWVNSGNENNFGSIGSQFINEINLQISNYFNDSNIEYIDKSFNSNNYFEFSQYLENKNSKTTWQKIISDDLLLINLLFIFIAIIIQCILILHVTFGCAFPKKTDHWRPKDFSFLLYKYGICLVIYYLHKKYTK